MPKHTTADRAKAHVVIVTLDNHITGAVARVNAQLAREVPGLTLSVHAASNWGANPDALAACIEELQSQAGRRYDARVVKACVKLLREREARPESEATVGQRIA